MLMSLACAGASADFDPTGLVLSTTYEFENGDPFSKTNSTVKFDSGVDNMVYSVDKEASCTLTSTVTDGVFVIETDIYVDYDANSAGTICFRIDDGSSDSKYCRMNLFKVSTSGKTVGENGKEGGTVFNDASWYRIRLVVDGSARSMTAKYAPISAPGQSGEWADVKFSVVNSSGATVEASVYPFDEKNRSNVISTQKTFPQTISRIFWLLPLPTMTI